MNTKQVVYWVNNEFVVHLFSGTFCFMTWNKLIVKCTDRPQQSVSCTGKDQTTQQKKNKKQMYNNFIIKPMHTCLVFMHCPIFQGLTKFGPGQSILKFGCLWATIPFTKFISYIANM